MATSPKPESKEQPSDEMAHSAGFLRKALTMKHEEKKEHEMKKEHHGLKMHEGKKKHGKHHGGKHHGHKSEMKK